MPDSKLIASNDFERAVSLLRAGEVVAVPTDTVYGLAVSLRVPDATGALFATKLRPETVALPVMVDDLAAALALTATRSQDSLRSVGEAFWPGPLTAIVDRDRQSELADVVLGGDESTIGLRVPAIEVLRDLCRICGPLGVSSANLHGENPCTSVAELRRDFGSDLVILDGGVCQGRVSTVIDLRGTELRGDLPVIVREGEISRAMISTLFGR